MSCVGVCLPDVLQRADAKSVRCGLPVEEWYLVKFFGDDYKRFQKEVPARIPFIR